MELKHKIIMFAGLIWLIGIPIAEVVYLDYITGYGEHMRKSGADASGELAYLFVFVAGFAIQFNLIRVAIWVQEKINSR